MAITILEALAGKTPNGRKILVKNESLMPIYRLVERHMAEIEEAQSRGYSWAQIDTVCRELWKSDPEASKIVWWKTPTLIESCYALVKRGKKPCRINPRAAETQKSASKKYNIEVTEA